MKPGIGTISKCTEQSLLIKNRPTLTSSQKQNFNPFKGKTFEEIDIILRQKGFNVKGPDPVNGKGSYFHPITNRKYYLDHAGRTYRNGVKELPHVDVHYKNQVGSIEKKRFPLGDNLYE